MTAGILRSTSGLSWFLVGQVTLSPLIFETIHIRLQHHGHAHESQKLPARIDAVGETIMDRLTPERRSAVMKKVKSAGTNIEQTVRRLLHGAGYRYRVNTKGIPGRPDLVFSARRKAIFVHGCFWHGHNGCKRGNLPVTRREFWSTKIDRNKLRDSVTNEQLAALGWSVLVLWQCELSDQERLMARLRDFLGHPKLRRHRAQVLPSDGKESEPVEVDE